MNIMSTDVTAGVRWVLRLEGLCVLIVVLIAYSKFDFGWSRFFVLFFLPDVSLVGYLMGHKVGAFAYNMAHSYVGAVACLTIGLLFTLPVVLCVGMIWSAHVAFDRALGYGLKYAHGFSFTHLGRIGRHLDNK